MTRCVACYGQWIAGQEAGLGELEAASANAASGLATDDDLRAAVDRCMAAYQDYAVRRRELSDGEGAPAFLSPPWCTAFENSVLWLGGCRPTLAIRLLYSLCGEGLEARLDEFLGGGDRSRSSNDGVVPPGGVGVTAAQLTCVNDIHRRTLRQEGALSDRLATLQEDIADRPLLPIVRERAVATPGCDCDGFVLGPASSGSIDPEVDAAMDSYRAGLARLLAVPTSCGWPRRARW